MQKNQNAITKEHVLEVYADIREKMLAIGAPVYADVTLEYMPKSLKMRMGDCKRLNKEATKFRVRLHPVFLSGFMSEASLCETLAHELVHTFPECQNHGKRFQFWCARLNAKYGWGIGTYANAQTTREYTRSEAGTAKTFAVCMDCGCVHVFHRHTTGIERWSQLGHVTHQCACNKHKTGDLVVLRYKGQDFSCPTYVAEGREMDTIKWFNAHLPIDFAEHLCGDDGDPRNFHWTAEMLQPYWWIDDEKQRQKAIKDGKPLFFDWRSEVVTLSARNSAPNFELECQTVDEIHEEAEYRKMVAMETKKKSRNQTKKEKKCSVPKEQLSLF